jgi:hypothetical protein
MVTDPLNRADSRFAGGMKPTMMRKCVAVTVTASNSRPDPVAIPIAADSHTAAAVVSPCTEPRRKMMMPAPRKPMPETIWAATRDGSTTRRPSCSTSEKPYEQDEGGRRADDGLGAHPGAFALDLALETDQRSQAEGDEELDDLSRALSRAAEERRVRQPDMRANKLTRCGLTDDFRRAAKSIYPRPIR